MKHPLYRTRQCLEVALQALLFVLLLMVCSAPVVGKGPSSSEKSRVDTPFYLVHSQAHASFADAIALSLAEKHRISLTPKTIVTLKQQKLEGVFVTMGKQALSDMLNLEHYRQQPLIATLISSRDYARLTKMYGQANSTALYSDPSPLYQIRMVADLIKAPRIAFIHDEFDAPLLNRIQQQILTLGLPEPVLIPFDDQDVNELLEDTELIKADVLLATPNAQIYNRENTKNIIFTLLSRNQGLIGYSSGWVSSGALASVYSSKEMIIDSLAEFLQRLPADGRVPAPTYPSEFEIMVNGNIARMLGVKQYDEKELLAELLAESHAEGGMDVQ